MIDTSSDTWNDIKLRITDEIGNAQNTLEQRGTTEKDRDYYSGYIGALRSVLAYPASRVPAPGATAHPHTPRKVDKSGI